MLALTPLLAAVLLVGCSKSEPERIADAAAKRYGRIEVGMTKDEVVAKLGEPASRDELRYRWETVGGPESKAGLEVRFDSAGKVASVRKTRVSHD